jgi:hypothetical protein
MSPHVSRAAVAAGVPARYVYWSGRSGRRYLFTRTGNDALPDFEEGVAIVASGNRTLWVGDATALALMPRDAAARRGTVYLHLLAATPEARRGVVEDLRPAEVPHLRLAA